MGKHIAKSSSPTRAINTLSSLADVHKIPPMAISSSTQAYKHQIKSEIPDFDKYRPSSGWVNVYTIKETFKHTTQWGSQVQESCP